MSIESRSRQYGRLFGDWNVEKLLGTGSNGKSAVFSLYRDNNGWREECALKVVSLIEDRGSLAALPEFRRQEFQEAAQAMKDDANREVMLMNQLRGKTNIVDYLDHRFQNWSDESGFGVDLLIRMEKLRDLRGELTSGRIFREDEIIQLGMDICRALILCHGKNILHRDIKPENIFLNQDGDFKLGDFGIARIMSNSPVSRASTGIGTAAYSAPEQTRGSYDQRVDIYSLGLVMYELLNGNRLPFATSAYVTEQQVQLRLSGAPLPPPQRQRSMNSYVTVPAAQSPLAEIILRACAFDPRDRYASAEDMFSDLQLAAAGGVVPPGPVHPPEPPVPPDPPTPPRQKQFPLWIPLVAISILLTGLICAFLFRHKHTWTAADCTTARTCSVCGEVSGEPIGHFWLDATCTNPKICSVCGATSGARLEHSWTEADCLNPQICSVCGFSQGSPIGHRFTAATCTEPETCTACGQIMGNPLGHDWREATFLEPMTCSRCGDTSGDPIPINSISVEDEIEWIRSVYYDVMDRADRGQLQKVTLDNYATAYYDSYGDLVRLDVPYGLDGLGSESAYYSRIYIYSNKRLIFAFFAGQDSHRLYFYEEMLIRWLYRPNQYSTNGAVTYDLAFSEDYLHWEALALAEGRSYLD